MCSIVPDAVLQKLHFSYWILQIFKTFSLLKFSGVIKMEIPHSRAICTKISENHNILTL